MEPLSRYTGLVDDPGAFLRAAARPLPRAVWANTLRTGAAEVESWLADRCPEAEQLSWAEGAWRVPPASTPGKWPEFALGLVHVQEEITLRPVQALAPRAGEEILDMCAAPGNKTARIAMATDDSVALVANEIDWRRLPGLQDVSTRLGITSVAVSRGSGLEIPGTECFDRVLVDAPCTGEGTSRKGLGRQPRKPRGRIRQRMAALQTALLQRAVELTRPGGVVVYCTCTYAPEENEAVLDGIDPAVVRIEPLTPVAGLRAEPGVTEWRGASYRGDVIHAARYWPHHNDTGGFFVARLRRL